MKVARQELPGKQENTTQSRQGRLRSSMIRDLRVDSRLFLRSEFVCV